MKLIKVKNYSDMAKRAAEILIDELSKKPNSVIGFATGKTCLGLYKNLISAYRKKKIDFARIKSFNLDEYFPIKKTDKRSMHYFMHKNLFDKTNIKKININLFDGETKNYRKECKDYEGEIKKTPIDLQILGLGINGHIGYNEPGSTFDSKTRLIDLSGTTIRSKFGSQKNSPRKALTMGIKTIMSAKKILLLASGKEKRIALNHLLRGKINTRWPVSVLQKHKNLVVVADKQALGR